MGELGSWLVRSREARGLTLEDAERDTRISRRYLLALETEQFEIIPAPVYARGFLRSYSQYLGLDPQEMLSLFPSEDGGSPAMRSVGVGRPSADARPSMNAPLSAQSPARPNWDSRRDVPEQPRPSRSPSMAPRPGATQQASRQRPPQQIPQPRNNVPHEPTIGIDIGVPVPARRLKQDPAAQTRSLTILIVAIVAIVGVVVLALVITRLGGDDPPGTSQANNTPQAASAAGNATATATVSSGIPVERGIVPDVVGLTSEKARLAIQEAGFSVTQVTDPSSSEARGTVVDQAPAAGQALEPGQKVLISVSDGP